MERDVVFALLEAELPRLRAAFGVAELAVFGSVARGEATPASDVDVLVRFEGPATFDGFMGLGLALEDLLGVKVDLVTHQALKPRMRAAILEEARRIG